MEEKSQSKIWYQSLLSFFLSFDTMSVHYNANLKCSQCGTVSSMLSGLKTRHIRHNVISSLVTGKTLRSLSGGLNGDVRQSQMSR